MKTIHYFKPDFKHYHLIPKEWLSLDEAENISNFDFKIASFRHVNDKYKIVNTTKDYIMSYYKLGKEDIVSESILEEDPFNITDGMFIITTIKGKHIEEIKNETVLKTDKDPNFFFIRDVYNLINKYYFDGSIYEKTE